ncbi:hypothetical protein D3C72_2429510 [compost metagenome]
MFRVTPLFQPVPTDRNTADPREVAKIWQFNRMADMLPLIADGSIGSLRSILSLEQQGVLDSHVS